MTPRQLQSARWWATALLLALVGLLVAVREFGPWPGRVGATAGVDLVAEAFRDRRSGFMVEVEGTVTRLLRDDLEGSPHQRFILELEGGHTLLVAHNLDLADRVPVSAGDRTAVRGQYEWNERGGVLHWTHHDPSGRRLDTGWIRHREVVYR